MGMGTNGIQAIHESQHYGWAPPEVESVIFKNFLWQVCLKTTPESKQEIKTCN